MSVHCSLINTIAYTQISAGEALRKGRRGVSRAADQTHSREHLRSARAPARRPLLRRPQCQDRLPAALRRRGPRGALGESGPVADVRAAVLRGGEPLRRTAHAAPQPRGRQGLRLGPGSEGEEGLLRGDRTIVRDASGGVQRNKEHRWGAERDRERDRQHNILVMKFRSNMINLSDITVALPIPMR